MKVALVYDRVNKWGGAERVLLTLHEMFPEAPLYTSVYDSSEAPWANVFPRVIPSSLQKIPLARRNHEFLALLMPLAFESFDFSSYDLVISVTSEAAKGIITKPNTRHVCYCLTPTRYLWSHHKTYFKEGSLQSYGKPAVSYLRSWDLIASQRPDLMVAISTSVQKRIKKYYKRESEVIYPPVSLKVPKVSQGPRGNYYLVVSRLVSYKRVDLAIDVFNKLGLSLVVVGTGREEGKLKEMAHSNSVFESNLTDRELLNYYRGTEAFIMPQEEDFGLVAVEAQMAGCPVIAYKAGGGLDTVIPGKTGIFFDKQNAKSLLSSIRQRRGIRFDKRTLVNNARRFSQKEFRNKFMSLINQS
jgi:glycosyltransferase involved in cell wall biosynthesis